MKVAYWSTSSLEPDFEAVSFEVFDLARRFPGSWIFGISPHYLVRFSRKRRYGGLHSSLDPFVRVLVRLLQNRFDVNHVYGILSPWTFERALTRKPIVHTVTQAPARPRTGILDRCARVVVQTDATYTALRALGVPAERLHLWYPGVDLERFRPVGPPATDPSRLPILFAAAPRRQEEMSARGVSLLLEAAKRHRALGFRFLYRPWSTRYTSHEATLRAIEADGLSNVMLTNAVESMHEVYPQHAFTVIPFLERSGGKESPNSALESLACGIPVLVSSACPLAEFVEANRCGVSFEPDPESLAAAVERGLGQWAALSANARAAAERHLDAKALHGRYRTLYDDVRTESLAGRRS